MAERLIVRKTYKLFLGGDFPRSESGRSYEISDPKGAFLANASRASRKDLRDAVKGARAAWSKWSGATAYNRGQVLYRIAEMMETRRDELVAEVGAAEGKRGAIAQVDDAIDTWVWYAGLADKLTQIMGGLNPVAGPYFNITVPEPTGVCGIVAPRTPSLAGIAARIAPALCGGNVVIALASEPHPLPAITMAECMATSDVPKGVVSILTGHTAELTPWLAGHGDVDALDITGVPLDLRADVERAGAENVKRIVKGNGTRSPYEATAFMEMKTVWHPKGA
ncbi:MAG: aldehyde dehydrogenase family protein [Actinomycetota bacterium]|nr:aldehyde dehydrogenase family protein [Actinomycetota bacterium]